MTNEPLLQLMADLPQADSDPARAARVRARCQAVLARRARQRPSLASNLNRFWTPVIASLAGVYLAETIHQALRFSGIL
jgi:hypothetical protein